ncbi:MAG: hypothetical protein HQK87_11955, partial [Nitrospinae bacterium]|nr:hypothetical protein [Nitrospinota bacterium]
CCAAWNRTMMPDPSPCPRCGATDGQRAVVYLGGVQRLVCGDCGATVRTFIRGTDFLLVGVVAAVILFWLVFR